ncbi:MAG TPA: hypothetical protein VJ921_02090, partial [Vicinamibacteria bacterium]|nr:hypothetical protein [Vicinamibacteria bacterium]
MRPTRQSTAREPSSWKEAKSLIVSIHGMRQALCGFLCLSIALVPLPLFAQSAPAAGPDPGGAAVAIQGLIVGRVYE